jgi:hypothetical protein
MSKKQCPCVESHFKGDIHAECYRNEEHNCHERQCECDCHYQEEPLGLVIEPEMCRHEELIVASRNAVVGLRQGLFEAGIVLLPFSKENNEISRQENAYDALLIDIEDNGCKSCKYDEQDPNRESNYLHFIAEYVEHFGY